MTGRMWAIGLLSLGQRLEMREDEDDDPLMWNTMSRSRGAVVRDDIATRYDGRLRYTYHEAMIK
jgi:hypothetical protein